MIALIPGVVVVQRLVVRGHPDHKGPVDAERMMHWSNESKRAKGQEKVTGPMTVKVLRVR
jgi:hypothetical protein